MKLYAAKLFQDILPITKSGGLRLKIAGPIGILIQKSDKFYSII